MTKQALRKFDDLKTNLIFFNFMRACFANFFFDNNKTLLKGFVQNEFCGTLKVKFQPDGLRERKHLKY